MNKKRILTDHKRKGKILSPPLSFLGNFKDSKYVENAIPEIIWITLLNTELGLHQGTEVGLKFIKIVRKAANVEDIPFYISWYSKLSDKTAEKIKNELIKENIYDLMNLALSPLLNVYSECPLNKLFISKEISDSDLKNVKKTLTKLYDKKGRDSTFSLGNVIYFFGSVGKLKLVKNNVLSQLPKLIDYPNTELSKMLGSAVRATTNVIINDPIMQIDVNWNSHFWVRGIELEPCII